MEFLYVSTIDHLLWNEAMDDIVKEAGDDMSDHSPIYCVDELENFDQDNHPNIIAPPKPKVSLYFIPSRIVQLYWC